MQTQRAYRPPPPPPPPPRKPEHLTQKPNVKLPKGYDAKSAEHDYKLAKHGNVPAAARVQTYLHQNGHPNVQVTGQLNAATDAAVHQLSSQQSSFHAAAQQAQLGGAPASSGSAPVGGVGGSSDAGSGGGGGNSSALASPGGAGSIAGAQTQSNGQLPANYKTIVTFLMAHGYSKNAACGVAGNIMRESGGNPESVGSGGNGLIGWTPPLAGAVTGNPAKDLAFQLNALLQYNQKNGNVAALNKASSPAQAAAIYMQQFERPAAATAALDIRSGSAEAVAKAMG